MNISLCIPTLNRWNFLKDNIPHYLTNPYISEIVICDENGEDVKKIKNVFTDPKIKTFINSEILGPFKNKEKVVLHASNQVICLIDSDNFAPIEYFEAWLTYIKNNGFDDKTVYCPEKLYEHKNSNFVRFDFTCWRGQQITKENIKELFYKNNMGILLNTGNYIFSKDVYLKALTPSHLTKYEYGIDVFTKNRWLLDEMCKLVVVPNMNYIHTRHQGSYYLQTHNNIDHKEYDKLYV